MALMMYKSKDASGSFIDVGDIIALKGEEGVSPAFWEDESEEDGISGTDIAVMMAGINDLPPEMIDHVFSYITDIEEAVHLANSSSLIHRWWLVNRGRYAMQITERAIPANDWPLAVILEKARSTTPNQSCRNAMEILAPFAALKQDLDTVELSDGELLAIKRTYDRLVSLQWNTMKGYAQLHIAARHLVPDSGGDLDHPLVVEHFLPLHYAVLIAAHLDPKWKSKPDCFYGWRANWFIQIAQGVMSDLKPNGWWEGVAYYRELDAVTSAIQYFIRAQVPIMDPDSDFIYL